MSPWLLALLDIVAIAAVAWLGGTVVQRLHQPRIAGEMAAVFAAVLLLGGQIADVVPGQEAQGTIADLFPETALTLVTAVGTLGFILYMLLVGITIDPAPMRERGGAIVLLAAATVGAMLALALVAGPLLADAGGWKPRDVSDGVFVLALTAVLAANGLPIVARILEDRAMTHSPVGSTVIVAATLATALALIGAAVAIGGGDVTAAGRVGLRVGAGLVLLALALAIARARWFSLPPIVALVAVVALAVGSALVGDELLRSLLIGPLIVGVAVTKAASTAVAVERWLGVAVRRVGLPVFIGLAALHTDLRELGSGVLLSALPLLGAVIALKLAAGYAAARTAGFAPTDARAIGALMQCSGVMTIAISLDVLDAHLIDARMHATLTLVGLVTTIAVGPLLPRRRRRVPARAGGWRSGRRRPARVRARPGMRRGVAVSIARDHDQDAGRREERPLRLRRR
ncbi:MAG: cation:proton antiporter [Solirubrobacteraceae bacterium]